jgi:hypothetical protein
MFECHLTYRSVIYPHTPDDSRACEGYETFRRGTHAFYKNLEAISKF